MDEPVIDTSTPETLERDFMAWLNVSWSISNSFKFFEFSSFSVYLILDFRFQKEMNSYLSTELQSDPSNTPIRKSMYTLSESKVPSLLSQFADAFEVRIE